MNGETNPDDSNQNGNNSDDGGDSQRRVSEKAKVRWETDLQLRFLEAMEYLGQHKAVPKKILEFMNVDGITRAHVASHLQKYRKYLKRLKQRAREAEMSRRAMNTNFASSSYFNQQGSYINTSLNMDNLFQSHLDYGLGQSNLILNNNNPINYMHHGRPIYDLSQTRSNLLPMGGNLGFFSSVLPLNEERRSVFATPQVSRVQYGTPNDVLGMNSNRGTGYMRSNYAGISIDANGNLVGLGGARVNGNGNGSLGESFGAMNWNFNNNNMSNHGRSTLRVPSTFSSSLANEGQTQSNLIAQMDGGVPRSIFETSQIPRFGQYGTTNDVYYDGINTNEYGDLIGLGGARGKGNVNGSLGENVGTMNWNFNNNNMTNHGSSTSRYSSPFSSFFVNEDQSQSNLNAQTDGLVPILENLSMCNYHHDIGNTINSQFNQNQHQGQVSAGVPKLSNDVLLERNAISNWNFNNQHQGQVSAANPKLSNDVLLERNAISNWNFDNHQGQASAGNLELSNDVFLERDKINNWSFDNHQGQVSAGNPELSNDVLLERNAISNWSFNNHHGQVNAGGNPKLSNDILHEKNAINNWSFDNHQGQVSAGNPELSNDVLLERNAISNWSFNNHHGQVNAGGNPKLSNDILHEKNAINNWSFDNHQGQVSAGNPELSNDVLLEKNAVNNWSFNNHQGQVNAGNSELANDVLLERNAISNWSFDNHQGQMNVEKLELANDVLFEKNATSNWNFGNHQGQVNAGHSELANDVLLERNAIRNWSFDNHQGQMNAGNPELANNVLFERNATSNWNFGKVNDNPNEEMLISIAANSEMYIPTPDMNTINQEQGVADLAEFPWLPIDPDGIDGDFMNYMLDDDVML